MEGSTFVCSVFVCLFFFYSNPFSDVVVDSGNMVAEKSIEAAMTYFEKNNGAKVAKKSVVSVDGKEAYVTVEKGFILKSHIQ